MLHYSKISACRPVNPAGSRVVPYQPPVVFREAGFRRRRCEGFEKYAGKPSAGIK
jgi:hypothetical protein